MTTYFLAPNPRWSAHTQTGFVAAGGKLYTYALNSSIPKATYLTPVGPSGPLNTNPIILDSKGEANIYWADDSLYRIELYDSNNNLIYTQDNYPYTNASGGTPPIVFSNIPNLIRNPQFTFWTNTTSFTNLYLQSSLADDWVLYRNNANATIAINQQPFILGQTIVPANPIYYLHYECTDIGAGGETSKIITQSFQSVQTLAAQEISFALWAKSSTNSPLIVYAEQYFGTGGSPSNDVVTTILSETLTNTWAQYTGSITVPNVNGMTLGTNADDQLFIDIALPLNAIADIDIANVQLQASNTLSSDFPYQTVQGQFTNVENLVNNAVFSTGDIKMTFASIASPGWLLMNDGSIGNYTSGATTLANDSTKALFELLWNNVSDSYAILQNSSGTPIIRGTSAEDDFNANNRIVLTQVLGRALASAGAGAGLTARALGESYSYAETVTLTTPQIPSHTHPYTVFQVGGVGIPTSGGGAGTVSDTTGATGGGGPHENMQPTVFLNVMIKL